MTLALRKRESGKGQLNCFTIALFYAPSFEPLSYVGPILGTQLTKVPLRLRPSDSQSALVQVVEADIHAVAGLLKLYLRDLPEPLFTDYLYPKFVEANGASF